MEQALRLEIKKLQASLSSLQERVERIELTSGRSIVDRYHLLRVKNKEELSDQYIIQGMGYLDLSPDKAFRVYGEQNKDFIILDVSSESYTPFKPLEEARKIPLESLEERVHELTNRAQSIFVISENGTKSILACKLLNQHGFFNLNNISGGYKFWPGFRLSYDHNEFDDFLKEA